MRLKALTAGEKRSRPKKQSHAIKRITQQAAWWSAVHRRADVLRADGERAGVLEYEEAREEIPNG